MTHPFRLLTVTAFAALAPPLFTTAVPAAAPVPPEVAAESAKANAFFDRVFDEALARNPEWMTQFGLKRDQDKWADASEAAAIEQLGHQLAALAELRRTINYRLLDPQTQISYRLWVDGVERSIEAFPWRHHNYPVNQMWGPHTGLPALLINQHRVDTVQDARDYVARLHGLGPRIGQVIDGLHRREALGVVPPRWVFPLVIESARAIITGTPFAGEGESPLWQDFNRKLAALPEVPAITVDALRAEARSALLESVGPAYVRLIATLERQQANAPTEDGVWRLPRGRDYYDQLVRNTTTTDLSAAEIHAIGLAEVARLTGELDALRQRLGFAGSLPEFYESMRSDPRFILPATEEGRAEYLARVNAAIDAMRQRLPHWFATLPRAELVVRPVEAFRQRGAAQAFYQRPSPDGRLPGIYYVNFHDMSALPTYQLEAVAYHEALPGHHLQIAIASEMEGLPKFRRFGFGNIAYTEGWALYCERLAKEMGGYADDYAEFGRLSMELLRAGRLVADTGIHAQRWSREQAIAWMSQHLPTPRSDIVTEVNRYIVIPSQATAYLIGQRHLLELRARAEAALGDRFDIRKFHDVVLRHGVVPLDLLSQLVDEWIAAQRAALPR
jgi:uncharacterized protein (DUF885 family)